MSQDGWMPLTPQDFLGYLDVSTQQFADLVASGDLAASVSSCPEWTFEGLVAHLGEVHQWATHAIVAGNPDAQYIPAPSGRVALVEWYRDSVGVLLSTLQETDPLAPAWAFGPKPRTASFWFRRQAHETAIHLWDAASSQSAQGTTGRGETTSQSSGTTSQSTETATQYTIPPIDNTLALDGIDELGTMFFPGRVRLGRIPPLGRTLALEAAGTSGPIRWVLAGDGTGPASEPDAPAEATISGSAEALFLLLWGRTSLDDVRLTISGDETAAHVVLNSAIAP